MNGPVIFRKVFSSARSYALKQSYSTDSDVIKIPKRIPRGPTDILKALAKTHQRDVTAAHYKYHDDPYLMPYSNSNKRSYALSLEAGRKAAHWIRQEHAELFNHTVADPQIELFVPSKVYKEDTDVSVEDLKSCIKNYSTSDAISVYQSLEKQGIELDGEVKQSLLELLCFYNCEDCIDEEWLEERWFRSTNKRRDLVKKTWKDNGIAEKLFKSMKPPTAEAYCAIISGMAKYGQAEGAIKLYEEAKSSNITLSVSTYNNVIAKTSILREGHDLIWKLSMELVSDMKAKGLEPNLGTFNALLETLSFISVNRNARKYSLQVMAEMKTLNIEPSPASFFHLLNIFYSGSQNSGILFDIVDYIDGKNLEVRDVNDCMLFVTAMEMCRHKLHNVALGYKIDKILHQNDNYNLIGDCFRESMYYRYLFSLLCEGEPLDDFLKVYDDIVPHLYTPEPSIMMDVLNSVEVNMGHKHLPKLWTDMTQFDMTDRQNLLIKMLELMNQTEDQELIKQFVLIGWNIWEKLERQRRDRNLIEWTGGMLSDLLKLLLKNNEYGKANLVFDKLDRMQNNLTGEPDTAVLRSYVTSCLQNNSHDTAIKCVRYCQDMGFAESDEFASLIEATLTLTEQQKKRLNTIMGKLPSS